MEQIGSLLPAMNNKTLSQESQADELKCSFPPEHKGKKFSSLASRHLRCLDIYGAQPDKDAAVLVGVLIGLLLAIPIALTVFTLYRRGYLFFGKRGPATFSRAFYKRTVTNDDI